LPSRLAAGQERFEHGDDFPDEQKADVNADEAADQRENDGRFHRRFDVSQNRREPRPNSGDGGSHINEPFRHGRYPLSVFKITLSFFFVNRFNENFQSNVDNYYIIYNDRPNCQAYQPKQREPIYHVFDVTAPINKANPNGNITLSMMINSSMIDETNTRQSKFALKFPCVHVNQYSVVVIAAGAAGAAGDVIPANAATIASAYNNIYILYAVLFIYYLFTE